MIAKYRKAAERRCQPCRRRHAEGRRSRQSEQAEQLRLLFETADSPQGGTARADRDGSRSATREPPKWQEHEEDRPAGDHDGGDCEPAEPSAGMQLKRRQAYRRTTALGGRTERASRKCASTSWT